MAIPVARVHLAMAHAALPGLLPVPPKCTMMMPPLLPTPPCVVILPTSSPPKPSRADAAERWDAHKTKPAAGSPTSSLSSGGRRSLDGESGNPGRASSCERWDSNKKKIATAAASSSVSRTSSSGRSSSSSSSRADSEERWDACKKPVSMSSSSSSARSNNKGCDGRSNSSKRRPNSRATSNAGRWDAHKKPTVAAAAAAKGENEIDDGESSTGSNDMEYLDMPLPRRLPQRALYAGPGFMTAAPHPSMLPMPLSLMRIRVA